MAVILYGRVSTLEQSIDHQVAQARAAGFQIDEVLADYGVSGVKFRLAERPEGRRLFDRLRSGDILVVRWLDRLGRSYEDVVDCMRHFIRGGIIVRTVINNMTFDGATTDPVQQAVRDAMIAFLAATAQAQAEATKIAQQAGIAAAKDDPRKYAGRKPSYDRAAVEAVRGLLLQGQGASAIARATGLSRQTVVRIRQDAGGVEEALSRWGMWITGLSGRHRRMQAGVPLGSIDAASLRGNWNLWRGSICPQRDPGMAETHPRSCGVLLQ